MRSQKGLFRWRLTFWIMVLIAVTVLLWFYYQEISNKLETSSPKEPPKKEKIKENKETIQPKPLPPKPSIKLLDISLKQQDNKTILDFVLDSPTMYYIEYSTNKEQIFITLNQVDLPGNLPANLEDTFLRGLNTKQNEDNVKITVTLFPGTKVDETRFISKPTPHLHLAFSNPQLVNSSMSKTLAPPTPEQRKTNHLKKIQQLLAQNKIQQAISKLYIFVGHYPNNLQTRTILVSLLIKKGKIKKAQEILAIGIHKNRDYAPFVKLQARIFIKEHKSRAAINLLEKYITTTDDHEFIALLAILYQQQRKFIPAAQLYNQLTKTQPQQAKWWAGLGLALESAGKQNGAKEAYMRAYNCPKSSPELEDFLNNKIKHLLKPYEKKSKQK